MTKGTDRSGATLNAIGFCIVGVLALLLRSNSRAVGGALVAYGLVAGLDAVLISRGIRAGTRFWIRLLLGLGVFSGSCLFLYVGRG